MSSFDELLESLGKPRSGADGLCSFLASLAVLQQSLRRKRCCAERVWLPSRSPCFPITISSKWSFSAHFRIMAGG